MRIAGLDIGTTGCKCTVFDENGCELGRAYRDYSIRRGTGAHEIDATVLIDAVYAVIGEMAHKFENISGIGVTSFGETFVMTDENGNVLAPAMLYTDPRGAEECAVLSERLGNNHIARVTGITPHEMYGLPKMMWQKRHNPEIFAKARHIMQMEDFVVYLLTGNAVIDYSLATRSMGFDIDKLAWSSEIFDAAEIDVGLMSRPVPTGSDAGVITKSVADKTGLPSDCHVIAISQDQVAAAIGSGAFSPDVAVKVLAKQEALLAKESKLSVNEYLEKQYIKKRELDGIDTDGPSGMLVLPHFAGAATPYMDTESKGVIIGLTTDTSVAEIYRGCMEGVTYEMYLNYRNVTEAGANIKKLHATGGGAHSTTWMQMKADVLNIPIIALNSVDAVQ